MTHKEWEARRMDAIVGYLGEGEILCQLAEEADELGKAALKYRRACGYTKNVTPVTREEAYQNMIEEIADVKLCLRLLGLDSGMAVLDVERVMKAKLERWPKRLFASSDQQENQ